MVTFIPFAGYRPAMRSGESIYERIAPPFDGIRSEELQGFQSSPCNVANLTLKADSDKHYRGAREHLDAMIADGSLKQDESCFYLYEQNFTVEGTEYRRLAIVGLLKVEELSPSGIMACEDAFPKVRADRLNLLKDTEAQFESVLGIVPDMGDMMKRADNDARLLYRFTDSDGTEHRFCRLTDESLMKDISAKMESQTVLVIDGHAIYETALAYAKENPGCEQKQYVLCALVPSDSKGMIIGPIHRLIDAEDIGETSAIKKIGKKVTLTEVSADEMKASLKDHALGLMFKSGRCFLADPAKEYDDPLMATGAFLARDEIINGVYKSDEGKSKASYETCMKYSEASIAEKKHDVAIFLNPACMDSVKALAIAGKKMPRKTAVLYPRIWSGWVFNLIR